MFLGVKGESNVFGGRIWILCLTLFLHFTLAVVSKIDGSVLGKKAEQEGKLY